MIDSDLEIEEVLVAKLVNGIMDPLLPYLTPNILAIEELKQLSKNDFGLNSMVAKLQQRVYMPGYKMN